MSGFLADLAEFLAALPEDVPVSVIGMAFAATGYLSPVGGAISQEVIDILAVLNALRAAFPGAAGPVGGRGTSQQPQILNQPGRGHKCRMFCAMNQAPSRPFGRDQKATRAPKATLASTGSLVSSCSCDPSTRSSIS